jgi:cytoskeletal protein CcmA (bactofilin family)
VTGDVSVGQGALEGAVAIGGKLTAEALRSHGALEVEGPVEVAGALSASGQLRSGLTLHAGQADLRGVSHVLGAVSVDQTLTVRGSLSAASLTFGTLELDGDAQVPGDLVGRSVSAHFTNPSALGTVRAPTVSLRAKVPNLVEKVLGRQRSVTVRRVEADSVELEGIDVNFVRAPQISLGREAHVTEYEGTIVRRHPSSRVGFESRSPRPYGLSR